MSQPTSNNALYGIVAEYADDAALLAAAKAARSEGYTVMDAYSPVPVHGLYEAMGGTRTKLPLVTLLGGLAGLGGGLGLQVWVSAIEYPINVGGRPFLSWAAFFPVTFACTILGAALASLIGMLVMNNFPEPYHPIFNTPNFDAATKDRYFFCIEAADPKFDAESVRAFLKNTGAEAVSEVEP